MTVLIMIPATIIHVVGKMMMMMMTKQETFSHPKNFGV